MSFDTDVRKKQKDHFSQADSAHISIDSDDTDQYVDRVSGEFHKRRREEWWKNYKLNYRNRHKDQIKARKSEIE